MKTKISHLLALLTLAVAAVLIENAFLQSMSINNQAYDLIAKTTINEISPQNFSLIKGVEKTALVETAVPLYPGAKKLTFGQVDTARYRIDAPAGKVAGFYNQIMALNGWSRVTASNQAQTAKQKLEKVVIALAENPLSKKTEAIFYHQPVGAKEIFAAQTALAEEAAAPSAPAEPVQSPLAPDRQSAPSPEPAPMPREPQPQPLPPTNGDYQPVTTNRLEGGTNNNNQIRQPDNNAEQQTCQLNGVTLQGACSLYNNLGQPGKINTMEFTRPQGDGQNGENGQFRQNGPSEEDQKKMDEQRLKDMKRGMSQFSRSITMMKKSVAKNKTTLSKCGVSIPEELSNALNSADGLVGKINSAKTADELDEVISDVQDVGSIMQDWGPRMGDLNRLCQMFKQADRDLKQLDRSLAGYTKKNSAKIDITEILAEYKTNVDGMRQALVQAKELAKTDAEEALTKLEDEFYGNMDNTRNSEQAINMVLNISKGIRQAASDIKRIESGIKTLKKKKLDTSAIEALTAEFKQQMEEIKGMVKIKFDVDDLIAKVETAFDTREQITDNLQEYGIGGMAPQIKENKSMNVQVNLPDAFKKQAGEDGGPDREMNGQPQNMMPQF